MDHSSQGKVEFPEGGKSLPGLPSLFSQPLPIRRVPGVPDMDLSSAVQGFGLATQDLLLPIGGAKPSSPPNLSLRDEEESDSFLLPHRQDPLSSRAKQRQGGGPETGFPEAGSKGFQFIPTDDPDRPRTSFPPAFPDQGHHQGLGQPLSQEGKQA